VVLGLAARAAVANVAALFLDEAAAVDAGDLPVDGHLAALARAGLYGAQASPELGGLGFSYAEVCQVVEELASCCLASTFVWVQHFRLLGAALDPATPAPIRTRLLPGVVTGEIKGGVVLTGAMPGPPRLTARPQAGGWALDGEAPWVSGWGVVDLLLVAARAGDDVVSMVVDARPQAGLQATELRLSAAQATRTVRLQFGGVYVPSASVVATTPYPEARSQAERSRLNASFPLGVARRCAQLLRPSPLEEQLAACRQQLDTATEEGFAVARAAANELALRAAHALAVARGSRSALAGDVAGRLTREAAFLLVFGTRPAIKEALFLALTRG
jgi:alkylation response protein AidB-like acyl-CoA dehydrogenase